jgi:hypothetical protein
MTDVSDLSVRDIIIRLNSNSWVYTVIDRQST